MKTSFSGGVEMVATLSERETLFHTIYYITMGFSFAYPLKILFYLNLFLIILNSVTVNDI